MGRMLVSGIDFGAGIKVRDEGRATAVFVISGEKATPEGSRVSCTEGTVIARPCVACLKKGPRHGRSLGVHQTMR